MTEQEAQERNAAFREFMDRGVRSCAVGSVLWHRQQEAFNAAWERSRHSPRVVEAAPSDTDRKLIDSLRRKARFFERPEGEGANETELLLNQAADALSRASQPVQVEPWKTANLQIVSGWLVERGALPLDYPAGPAYGAMPYSDAEPLVNLAEVPGWPVQVEVTEPTPIRHHARRDGKTEAMIERMLSLANERGIRVEVVYPQVEVTDEMVERAAETLWMATWAPLDRAMLLIDPEFKTESDWEKVTVKDDWREQARAALSAALGGGE